MRTTLHAIAALALALTACSSGGGSANVLDDLDASTMEGGRGTGQGDGGSGGNGNGGSDDVDGGLLAGLQSFEVSPSSIELSVEGPGVKTSVMVSGTFTNGETRDLTEEVHWSLDDERLGTIVDGVFTASGIGGETVIRVQIGGFADVEVPIKVVVNLTFELDVNLPPGASDKFPPVVTGDFVDVGEAPVIVYPSHETMFPRNVQRVLHQWTAAGLDLFEVRLDSDVAHIRLLTTETEFTPDADMWRALAESHAGRSLTFSVRGMAQADPSKVYRSQDVTLHYSKSAVSGALFYWSTGAEGVMRATIDAPVASKFYTDPEGASANKCVSCHTVSRNGKRLSAGFDGEKLQSIAMDGRVVEIDTGASYGWGTFDPPAAKLLYANQGTLRLLDAASGDALKDPVDLGSYKATHPDWAPSGAFVAVAVNEDSIRNKDVQGGSIGRIPVESDGSFGAVQVLVTPDDIAGADNLFFPAVSPDSKWIAFVAGVGSSKDDADAEIYVIPSAGGTPRALTRMNRRVRDARGVHPDNPTFGNSMPTWAPMSAKGTYFLAFSSLRAYADKRAADAKEDQLWAAALDPEKLGTAEDASFSAFWLPFQQIDEGNHRVFWVVDIEGECPGTIEICGDDLDNDCDGVVDPKGCCEPAAETCGDDLDNDCDGLVDEGCLSDCEGAMCECQPSETSETCGDGLDNDCDGDIDADDSDCVVIIL